MQCPKCGTILNDGVNFCVTCGEPIVNNNPSVMPNIMPQPEIAGSVNQPTINSMPQPEMASNIIQPTPNAMPQPDIVGNVNQPMPNVVNENVNNPVNMQQFNPMMPNSNVTPGKEKKGIPGKILKLIGGGVVILIALFVGLYVFVSSTTDKLVCKSPEGNITIMYDKDGIKGYTAKGIIYDLEKQQSVADVLGIDDYLVQFSSWFESNTTGSCTINGKKVEILADDNGEDTLDDDEIDDKDDKVKTVGDSTNGYVDIPSDWVKFYDIDGNDSIQYSYLNRYIISLNNLGEAQISAKDAASNYMSNKLNDSSVTDVTGATVTIGKSKKYTAYQVYMFYPSDATFLVTYWFEAEDGKIHYISLEGPSGVENYTSIPESFRLNN